MKQPMDDGFKWFGEGFDGFPRRLPDETVEYLIHVIDPNAEASALRDKLRNVQNAATSLVKKLLKDFIWQREPFNLELVREKETCFLRGRTNYGDSVEDEWLIVYLLRELSKQFPEVWIKTADTDGEFLLIEAANALPKWLNPEVADNRVWLNQGELMIIPPSQTSNSSPSTGSLSLQSALRTLATAPRSSLLHARLIEEEAFYRLRNYPAQIQANLHHALITVPRHVAFILHTNPAYISPAIEAFYLRDPIALRPLQESSTQALLFPPEDFVTARVKFTKVGYAQLKSQVFSAPGQWARALAPNASNRAKARQEIGMKVSCGLEMLLSDPQNVDRKQVREIKMLLEDLEAGEEKLPSDQEVREWGMDEDDEGWLDIDFNDLEKELQGKKGATEDEQGEQGEFGDTAAQENLRKMVERFEEFMNEDDLEDMDEDDDDSGSESSSDIQDQAGEGEDKAASFDEDEFTAMMREMMGMPKDVMEEIMGPKAAKARGVAREDGSTDPKIMAMDEKPTSGQKQPLDTQTANGDTNSKPVFGPERPPHMLALEAPELSSVAKGKQPAGGIESEDDEDVEVIPRENGPDSEDDEEQIRELTHAFEAELRKAGALSLDDPNETRRKGKKKVSMNKRNGEDSKKAGVDDEDGDSEPEMLDENFNLVSNMLESFKSQAGMSGPGGNMLGMMGMKLPRDEGDGNEESGGSSKASRRS